MMIHGVKIKMVVIFLLLKI